MYETFRVLRVHEKADMTDGCESTGSKFYPERRLQDSDRWHVQDIQHPRVLLVYLSGNNVILTIFSSLLALEIVVKWKLSMPLVIKISSKMTLFLFSLYEFYLECRCSINGKSEALLTNRPLALPDVAGESSCKTPVSKFAFDSGIYALLLQWLVGRFKTSPLLTMAFKRTIRLSFWTWLYDPLCLGYLYTEVSSAR